MKKFGNWTLVAAAYNAGNKGITKQMERQNQFHIMICFCRMKLQDMFIELQQ